MNPLRNTGIFGSWATLLMATGEDGNIDYSKLSEEIDVLIASNPNGIYSNGTAGEFYAQAENEFDRISQILSEKCDKAGVRFQIGVSHMSPQISLERLKRIRQLHPGAIQVILPDWFPVNKDEAVAFLQKMELEAKGISLVLYNPPHAKKQLTPAEWKNLKEHVPSLVGVKVFDHNANSEWYAQVRENSVGLSVFIPGHRLATGLKSGAHGSYSNIACLNPFAARRWYDLIKNDMKAGLELENRIGIFMKKFIEPLITVHHYSHQACDRFMAVLGDWSDIGEKLRWPYQSVPVEYATKNRKESRTLIHEFFEKW